MSLFEILKLLFQTLFGSNVKPHVDPVPAPAPPAVDMPEPASPVAKEAPNIIIPNPVNADNYGPASSIVRALIAKGHAIFDKDYAPHNLNIVGIRNANAEFDVFKCRLAHFWKHEGEWHLKSWPITTFPGKTYLVDRLLSPLGAAILQEGQHTGAYGLRKHRSIYEALCQNGPVPVYRDKNRDRVYDMSPSTVQTGGFGINLHATENPDDGISKPFLERVGNSSAGCQVFARVSDFVDARVQWRQARSLWGPKFTYTLIGSDDLDDQGSVPLESVAPQHSDKEEWNPGVATVGTRNRNLMNVKQDPRNPWKYSTGKDSKNHTIFPSYATGLRAGIINLRSYWVRHGLKTLSGITNRYAPASDTIGSVAGAKPNQPSVYATFISKRMKNWPVNSPLMLFTDSGEIRSHEQLFQMVSAIVSYENGSAVVLPRKVFDDAVALI